MYYMYILCIVLNTEQIRNEWFHFQLIQAKIHPVFPSAIQMLHKIQNLIFVFL